MPKLVFAITFLLSVQLVFAQNSKQDVAVIKNSRLASNEAIAKHNIDGISKYWLPDFVQTIGRGISTTGKDAVMAGWKDLFETNKTVSYVRTPTSIIVGDNNIMAWETGTWVAKNSYSKGGNYSAMWRKVNGVWMLQAELFVSLRKL
jgi:ketosteroid isomerase-like protein